MKLRLTMALVLTVTMICIGTATVYAQVPTNMNVQGRLTDSAGDPVPPGLVQFTFKIFDAGSGGTEVWPAGPGENQTVFIEDNGLWKATIGWGIPLTAAVFQDSSRWLEATVNDGVNPPETLSRVKLNTNPYAFVAGSLSNQAIAGLDDLYVNESGDVMSGGLGTPYLDLGDGGGSGTLNLWQAGAGAVISSYVYGGALGGAIDFWEEEGDRTLILEPDADGKGGFFKVYSGDPTAFSWGFTVDGKYFSDDGPYVSIAGPSSSSYFNTNATGNDAVQLPGSSLSAPEISDEPGISQQLVKGLSVDVTKSTTMLDIVKTTITTPEAGYIIVEITGMAWLDVVSVGDINELYYQIDETPGGTQDPDYYLMAGFANSPTSGQIFLPMYGQRVYYKPAGTYTFRLEARDATSGATGYRRVWNASIRATFIPTSYGTVTTVASMNEASQFEQAEARLRPSETPGGDPVGETGYLVDLRELEIRALKARAEAERLERELATSRVAEQERLREAASAEAR